MSEVVLKVRRNMRGVLSEEGIKRGLDFQPSHTDVVVVGYPKSWTTWMQQIVHQLRTGGDEDFEDILQVVPMLEASIVLGQDLEADQRTIPRCFKAHYLSSPKHHGKYIILLRNPYSVAYSEYKWYESSLFDPDELSLEEYVLECWIPPLFECLEKGSYFHFVASWYAHCHKPNVMFVFYEDLVKDYESNMRRIATFMGIENEENIRVALEKCSFEYMKKNWEKFSAKTIKRAHGWKGEIRSLRNKVRCGSTKEGEENLPLPVRDVLDSTWKELVEPVTGFSSYEELHQKMKK